MRLSTLVAGAAGILRVVSAYQLSKAAQSLFDFSMSINDPRWDDTYKVLWFNDNGPWSMRFTAWYLPGLLHRNQGDDAKRARAALQAILDVQMNYNYSSEWYGDFKNSPDEPNPTPNSELYAPSIYGSYDPNWREFIGSQLVQVAVEFEDLLGPDLIKGIETALAYDAVGAMRRNGTAPDNLVLAYTNPNYMRTLVIGWIGYRLNNQTFIDFANTKGTELFELFSRNGANTAGEYNAPNYAGEDMWALAANIKYGPKNATFTKNAEYILTEMWKDIADHYNPYLGNLAGPYDRAYTRDMPTHNSIISFFWWGVFGRDLAPQPPASDLDLNYDVTQGAALALLMDTVSAVWSSDVTNKLLYPFTTERSLIKTVYDDLTSNKSRTATSWLSKPLMAGGVTVNETVNRGKQFTPAIVHWAADPNHKPFPYNGFFSLYPSATVLNATASPNKLVISYPSAAEAGTDGFQFMLSGIPPPWNLAGNIVDGFSNLPCLSAIVTAPGLELLPTVYGSMIYSHYYYNITYAIPASFSGPPTITFDLKYTC